MSRSLPSKKRKWDLIHSCRVINWDRHSHRTSHDEVTGPEVLAVPLGVSQDGEGGVGGGVYPSQLFQGLAVLLQSLSGSLKTVREGQRGEGGGRGEFGLWKRRGEVQGKKILLFYKYYYTTQKLIPYTRVQLMNKMYILVQLMNDNH